MWKTFKAEFVALWKSRLRFASWIILLFMPLIYGLLFLTSFWSPFKNTDKLPIVVVNLDKGNTNALSPSQNLVNKLTNGGKDLHFNGGSSEYKINVKDATDIYYPTQGVNETDAEHKEKIKQAKTDVEKAVNSGTYSAAFVIPEGFGAIASSIQTELGAQIVSGNIDIAQFMQDIKDKISAKKAIDGSGLIDFYNSFKVSYVAGEMTNMGSTLYKLVGNLLLPDISVIKEVVNKVEPLLHDLTEEVTKVQTSALTSIAKGIIKNKISGYPDIAIKLGIALATKKIEEVKTTLDGVLASMPALQASIDGVIEEVKDLSGANDLTTAIDHVLNSITDLTTQIISLTKAQLQPVLDSVKNKVISDLAYGNILVDHKTYGKREGVIGKHDVLNTYGYGLSPYFISIVLWAGALLMVFLFPNKRYIKTEGTAKNMFGKLGVWIITGWIQTLLLFAFVSIPGIFGSITYNFPDGSIVTIKQCINLGGDEWKLILFGLFVSTMFMTTIRGIMHSIRVADVGLFLGVVLLILQLTSSGGTFPADMQPGFFKGLHKILPFTYVINAIREIYYEPSYTVILKDCGILLIIPTLFTGISYASNKIWDIKTKKVIDGKTYYKSMDKNIGSL